MSNVALNISDMNTLTLPQNNEIVGVEIKLLKSHGDDRGFFREIIRFNDPFFQGDRGERFAQWSHSKMQKNVVKAWHYHHVQFDWWYLGIGAIETVLYDNREESPTFKKTLKFRMGEPDKFGADVYPVCVKIPQGVLHGLKVFSEEAHLFYITSEIYNPNDEGRFPYNDGPLKHDWGKDVIVVDNDKRHFVPTSPRKKMGA